MCSVIKKDSDSNRPPREDERMGDILVLLILVGTAFWKMQWVKGAT